MNFKGLLGKGRMTCARVLLTFDCEKEVKLGTLIVSLSKPQGLTILAQVVVQWRTVQWSSKSLLE